MVGPSCSLLHCKCPGAAASSHGPGILWFAGIFCGVFGSLGTVTGMVLQKYAHNQQERGETKSSYFMGFQLSWMWFLGFVLLVFVPMPLDLAALALAPQSIIAPLSGVTIVLSQVVAPRMLKEREPSMLEWGWSSVIFIGTVLLALVGDQCSLTYSNPELKVLYPNKVFLMCEVCQFSLIGLAMLCASCPARVPFLSRYKLAQPLAYAYLSGALGGQQNVLLKASAENVDEAFRGNEEGWGDWFTYWNIFGCIALGTLQVMALNMGLALMEATRYLPVYNASLIVCSAIAGMSFYQEYERMTLYAGLGYGVAISIIVSGVIMLARSDQDSTKVLPADSDPESNGVCEESQSSEDDEDDEEALLISKRPSQDNRAL